MLRSARSKALQGRTGRDPCYLSSSVLPLLLLLPLVKVARQAGRSGQVAFRPPAGWAGPSMIWCFCLGCHRKHRSVRKSIRAAASYSYLGPHLAFWPAVFPAAGFASREGGLEVLYIFAATPERQSNDGGRTHNQPECMIDCR